MLFLLRRWSKVCLQAVRTNVRSYANLAGMDVAGSRMRPRRLSMYARERIRQLLSGGLSCSQVVDVLKEEDIHTCRQSVWRLKRHINTHGTLMPLSKSGRPTKLTDDVLRKIDNVMAQDDETTAQELVTALQTTGISVSTFTALKGHRLFGRGTAYCQLIRALNREKRLCWAQENLGAGFEDVI